MASKLDKTGELQILVGSFPYTSWGENSRSSRAETIYLLETNSEHGQRVDMSECFDISICSLFPPYLLSSSLMHNPYDIGSWPLTWIVVFGLLWSVVRILTLK